MIVQPIIAVDNCKDEIQYYQQVLGGEVVILRRQGEDVLNADLNFDGATIKFSDVKAAKPAMRGDYVRVFLRIDTEEAFRRIYEEFGASGSIHTEMYEAPFNGYLAIVSDRNGVSWVLSYYRE
ncbi:VOC family protein [Paenibacillus glycanilyticus]|uniref:Glyoxalase/fosfomycin resistance/dioxygenase domain-containing protein n=1 Tax=Paenibacillus glycanilyticus TaxID=126569 RepID=A0ABQ6GHF0_9BACL|nr:VOC family protein [Paenibacillus glycanilyticus]GLX70369.1 hypothetical protein MU1_47150 [Paenibacillus glycanilyticus]